MFWWSSETYIWCLLNEKVDLALGLKTLLNHQGWYGDCSCRVPSLPTNETNIESRTQHRIGERSSQPCSNRMITLDTFPYGMGSDLSQLVRLFLGVNMPSTFAMLPHVNSLITLFMVKKHCFWSNSYFYIKRSIVIVLHYVIHCFYIILLHLAL